MAEPIVVNTGPLVSFARIGCLDLIGRLPYEFLSPAEDLAGAGQRARRRPSLGRASLAQEEAAGQTALTRLAGRPRSGRSRGQPTRLDLGVRTVAIDEWKGRRGALASGLRVTGSLGLLGRAKAEGLISELKPSSRRR